MHGTEWQSASAGDGQGAIKVRPCAEGFKLSVSQTQLIEGERRMVVATAVFSRSETRALTTWLMGQLARPAAGEF